MPGVYAPRVRRSFARLENALELPNLIDIQRKSFDWLVDPKAGGLRVTIDDVSPIEDYTGNLAVELDRKSTRLNSSHSAKSRMPSSA